MNNVFNRDNKKKWIRPWNLEKFDDLYNRDERFFSIVMKGMISWLNRNMLMYNKSINHFVFNTGSSYLYIESNGYEYNVSEVTGEDSMYMQLPRCIVEMDSVHIPTEELTSPFSRGNYERRDDNLIRGFNAEIQRLPIEISVKLSYYLGTFNESLILLQEIIDKIVFQQYFNVTYLGNIIQCSIQFQEDAQTQINKIDMTSPDPNQRLIELQVTIDTSYPVINERSEIPTDKIIEKFGYEVDLYSNGQKGDIVDKGNVIEDEEFNDLENNIVSTDDFIDEKEGYIYNNVGEDYNPDEADQNMISDENGKIAIKTDYTKDKFIRNFDVDNDMNIDLEDLITKYDINKDGVIDETELVDLLEKIKYELYDESVDYTEQCHYRLDYKDVYYIIKLINKQDTISAHYDKFAKKIYVTHNDTGNTEEIDMKKYRVINNE